ncbi:hypothetical protein ACSQ67_025302 [Phaseolus vulgaris]
MKIVKVKKDEITSNGRKGCTRFCRYDDFGQSKARKRQREGYRKKYDNGWERHHISNVDVVVQVVIEAMRRRRVTQE